MTNDEILNIFQDLLKGMRISSSDIIESVSIAEEYKDSVQLWFNLKGGMLCEYVQEYDSTREEIERDLYNIYFSFLPEDVDNLNEKRVKWSMLFLLKTSLSDTKNQIINDLVKKFGAKEVSSFLNSLKEEFSTELKSK